MKTAVCLLLCALTSNLAGAAAADNNLLQRANSGDPKAEVAVGDLYSNGQGGLPKDPRKALEYYKRAADQGYAVAQVREGFLYATGAPGVPQDAAKAAALYRVAADQGNSDGMNDLGLCYEHGLGLPQDAAKAAALYRAGADRGNTTAMYNLSLLYRSGRGVPQDPAQSLAWLRKAAGLGLAGAATILGQMYQFGTDGVPRSGETAAFWYLKAADVDDAWGEYDIGLCYSEGSCERQDFRQAYTWIRKAAEQNLREAQCAMALIYLSGRGVAADRQEARSWFDRAGGEQGCAGYNPNIWSPPAAAPATQAEDDTARFFGTWAASFSVNGQTVTMISVHNANGFSNTWHSAQGDTPAGSGGFSAAGGNYKTTAPWPNGSGTYHFTDDDTVVCTNAAGQTVTWHRQKAAE